MGKLIELEREEFLTQVTDNWSKWKDPTPKKDLVSYIIDKAFSKKATSTLIKFSKDDLRDIIINGDEESVTHQDKNSHAGFASELIEFLDEAKKEIHKNNMNPFIKKQAIKQIDKQLVSVDENVLAKAGIFGLVMVGILLLLELVFEKGFKDIIKKIKERREAKTLEAEIVENDKDK